MPIQQKKTLPGPHPTHTPPLLPSPTVSAAVPLKAPKGKYWHCDLRERRKCKHDPQYTGAFLSTKDPEACRQACMKWRSHGCQYDSVHQRCFVGWTEGRSCIPSSVAGQMDFDYFAGRCYWNANVWRGQDRSKTRMPTLAPTTPMPSTAPTRAPSSLPPTPSPTNIPILTSQPTMRPTPRTDSPATLPDGVYEWQISQWGMCSFSCGRTGIKVRQVSCLSGAQW